METKIETISINGIEYVRADSIAQQEPAGDYVIVRSHEQGVMCGEYVSHSGREVTLRRARQIWSYHGGLCLPDVAVHGLSTGSRLSAELPGYTVMLEACGILPVSAAGAQSLREWPADTAGRE